MTKPPLWLRKRQERISATRDVGGAGGGVSGMP